MSQLRTGATSSRTSVEAVTFVLIACAAASWWLTMPLMAGATWALPLGGATLLLAGAYQFALTRACPIEGGGEARRRSLRNPGTDESHEVRITLPEGPSLGFTDANCIRYEFDWRN